MKSFLMLCVAMLLLTACVPARLTIYNGCYGSWVRVRDGRGNLLVDRLNYGQERSVELDAYENQQVTLLASGFRQSDNAPLGSATNSVYVPSSQNSITGPPQIQPWQITYLQTSDYAARPCQR